MGSYRNPEFTGAGLLIAVLCIATLGSCLGTLPTENRDHRKVAFTYTGEFHSVCLSGDFNGWSTDLDCLDREGDVWTIEIFLEPGRYMYGFVINGQEWRTDPKALLHETDGFGKKNSVIIVE